MINPCEWLPVHSQTVDHRSRNTNSSDARMLLFSISRYDFDVMIILCSVHDIVRCLWYWSWVPIESEFGNEVCVRVSTNDCLTPNRNGEKLDLESFINEKYRKRYASVCVNVCTICTITYSRNIVYSIVFGLVVALPPFPACDAKRGASTFNVCMLCF